MQDHAALLKWYQANKRNLPWRQSSDPYRIWVSEVMLQQTTVVAVIPYFEKFMKAFPNVAALAQAPLEQIYELWAGLGYYSRARNLHKAAQEIAQNGFPRSADLLIELSGFGPYTSRAVASIAFNEPVGVLDGNVIRVLSRKYGLAIQWWKPAGRDQLQKISDRFAQIGSAAQINQALMELGATLCTPHRPACLLCPWQKSCKAFAQNKVSQLPVKKPRRQSQIWHWQPMIKIKNHKVLLIKNDYAPFLKGQWIFPGTITCKNDRPKKYKARHQITHHDIFITTQKKDSDKRIGGEKMWVAIKDLAKINPSKILKKALLEVETK